MTTTRTQPNQPPSTGVHDSSSCNCSMCRWVTSRRQRPLHISMDLSPDGQTEWAVQHLAQLRIAILTVLDDGDPKCAGVPWELYESDCIDQAKANEQRLALCDAVQKWITERCK